MNNRPALAELLSRRYEIAEIGSGAERTYRHSSLPPIGGRNEDMPSVVQELLGLTDGVALFCSDDPALAHSEIPPEAARLYNGDDVTHRTDGLREQLRGAVVSSLVGGGLDAAQGLAFGEAIDQLWAVGSMTSGDLFVVEAYDATTICVYPPEVSLEPLLEPEGVVRCEGLGGLIDWLEAELRRTG
jgi:hypothetical protein